MPDTPIWYNFCSLLIRPTSARYILRPLKTRIRVTLDSSPVNFPLIQKLLLGSYCHIHVANFVSFHTV